MARSVTQRRSTISQGRAVPRAGTSRVFPLLTGSAFLLSVVLVIVRAMMTESIRPGNVGMIASADAPQTPGPATSLILDLLFCLPTLLVLARRAFDPGYVLRLSWSALPMALLGVWTAASVAWASDKFSAAISAANWCAALVFLWSTAQLVRSWLRLRLVAGVCFGLLIVLAAHGWYYRLIDWPDLKQNWRESSADLLRQMNKEPNSREAEQFARNIESGTPLGFSVSTNTYGALLVLTMAASAGVALQRRNDGDHPGWYLPIAIAVLPVAILLIYTRSKAVGATAVLGAGAFALLPWYGGALRRHARAAWISGVGVFVLGTAALVAHGLAHHSLPTSSLAFRWHYWVGSARLFVHHPILGVGWENFGPHYLACRLRVAPEEIRDPHDFFVRAFVELGLVGGLLMIVWILMLWWELAGPIPEQLAAPFSRAASLSAGSAGAGASHKYPAFRIVTPLAVVAVLLNIAVSFDWAAPGGFLIIEAMKRGLFLLFLFGGIILVVLPSMHNSSLDDRPAPWVLTGFRVALGLFLLHNLIEFSLFEPGATFLFALVAGSALGIRLVLRAGADPSYPQLPLAASQIGDPSSSGTAPVCDGASGRNELRRLRLRRGNSPVVITSPRRLSAARVAFAAGAVAWLAAAIAFAGPVLLGEASARDGDEHLRDIYSRNLSGPSVAISAAQAFESALRSVPWNADYAYKAAQAWRLARRPDLARAQMAKAIAIDPSSVTYHLARAQLELEKPGGEAKANETLIVDDFEKALALDPNNVAARINYAEALEGFGRRDEAAREYERALDDNAQLSREENKRLPDERVAEIKNRIVAMKAKAK